MSSPISTSVMPGCYPESADEISDNESLPEPIRKSGTESERFSHFTNESKALVRGQNISSTLATGNVEKRQQSITGLFKEENAILRKIAESPTVEAAIKMVLFLGIGKLIPTENAVFAQSLTLVADPIAKLMWETLRRFPSEPNVTHWREVYRDVMCSDYAKKRIASFPQEHRLGIEKVATQYLKHVTHGDLYTERNGRMEKSSSDAIPLLLKRWLFWLRPESPGKTDWDEPAPGENISRNDAMYQLIKEAGIAGGVFQALWFDIKVREEPDAPRSIQERRAIQPLLIGPPGIGKTTLFERFAKISGYALVVFDSASIKDLSKAKLMGDHFDSTLSDLNKTEPEVFGHIAAAYMQNSPKVLALFDNLDLKAFRNQQPPPPDWVSSPGQNLQTLFNRKNCIHRIHTLNGMPIDLSTWIIAATTNFKFDNTSDLNAMSDRFMTCFIKGLAPKEKRRRVRLYLNDLPEKFKLTPDQEKEADQLLDFIILNDGHNPSTRQAENAFEQTVSMLKTNPERSPPLPAHMLHKEIQKQILNVLKPRREMPQTGDAQQIDSDSSDYESDSSLSSSESKAAPPPRPLQIRKIPVQPTFGPIPPPPNWQRNVIPQPRIENWHASGPPVQEFPGGPIRQYWVQLLPGTPAAPQGPPKPAIRAESEPGKQFQPVESTSSQEKSQAQLLDQEQHPSNRSIVKNLGKSLSKSLKNLRPPRQLWPQKNTQPASPEISASTRIRQETHR